MSTIRRINYELPLYLDRVFGQDSKEIFKGSDVKRAYLPPVNVLEIKDAFEIHLAVPGYQKEDFKIDIENRILKISSEKIEKKETTELAYKKKEFYQGSFSRVFTLPNTIDGEKIEAHYENGVLYISLPKKDEVKVKQSKAIEVK